MKFSPAFLALCCLASNAQAFTTAPAAFAVSKPLMMSDAVAEPEVAEAAAEEAPAAPPAAALSGLSMQDVRKAVDSLDKDNFSKTLADLESYLTNEAGATVYAKSMRRMGVRAKALGLDMPENYAKDAKATLKKREKQTAFIARKEEERMEAEAAAAEAPPAEEETEEAAAPAEEEAAPVEA